jgi:hypothetical protein
MTNAELDARLKTICLMPNFIEAILAIQKFEPEYKKSDFYKVTKMPLVEVIKQAKIWYTVDFSELRIQLQKMIDGLSFEKITEIIDQVGQTFEKENKEIAASAEIYSKLLKDQN